MLPSGFKSLNVCFTSGSSYIDTGVLASSKIEVEIAFMIRTSVVGGTTRNFIFGARDGTSNTSKGLNLAKTFSNGYYFSFNTANTLMSSTKGDFSPIVAGSSTYDYPYLALLKFSNKIASLSESVAYNALDESSVADFTCTHSIYLFGLNNNGSVTYSPSGCGIAYCKIWDNGTLVKHYVACLEESSNNTGLYELIEGVFNPTISISNNLYNYTVDVAPTTNGNGKVEGTIGRVRVGEIIAVPNDGYEFTRWEFNGDPLSTENPLPFDMKYTYSQLGIQTGGTFAPVAIFTKKIEEIASLGFKMAVFSCVPTQYRLTGGAVTYRYLQKGVYAIRSANISIDGKQKTANTFVMDGGFNVTQGDYVYVYSQLGKNIFNGVIESYDNTTITCGEMKTVFSKDVLVHANSSKSIEYNTGNGTATVTYTNALISFVLSEIYLPLIRTMSDASFTGETIRMPPNRFAPYFSNIRFVPVSYSIFANNYYGETDKSNFPLITDTSVMNLHDYLCDLFSEQGIYVENRTIPIKETIVDRDNNTYFISHLKVIVYPRSASSDVLTIGDNTEQITNINVTEESDTTTALYIFNSAGTQCRGAYVIDSDGAIVSESSDQISVYVPKIVLSDDNLNTVVQSNLSAGKYNHQITFDVNLDSQLISFDDFKINKRVNFYHGNKMYRSVVTALSYQISENDDTIHSMKITLGMARNNLTSKLNLKKVKTK